MTTRKRQDTKESPSSSAGPHDTVFEDTDEVPSSWTSADNSAGRREGKQHEHPPTRISDLIDHADRRYLELSEALIHCPRSRREPIARLQGMYMRIITELDDSQHDEPRISGDKRSYAKDFPHRRHENEFSRDDIMDRLTDELLGIMTGDKQSTDAFRAIATGLASRLAKPTAQTGGITDTLLQLARATAVIQQLQASSAFSGMQPTTPVFKAHQKIIEDTEFIIAREVRSSPLGHRIASSLASSTGRTPFTTYVVSEGAPQSQWAMREKDFATDQEWQPEDPASPNKFRGNKTSNTNVARSPSQPRASSEPNDQRFNPGPPPGQPPPATIARHPVQERCNNHANRECLSSSCNRWHGKSNPRGAACRDHGTPGIWCERSYEVDGPGCPYSHEQPVAKPRSREIRRPGKAPPVRPPTPSSQKACWFDAQPEGCKEGDHCSHWHSNNRLN